MCFFLPVITILGSTNAPIFSFSGGFCKKNNLVGTLGKSNVKKPLLFLIIIKKNEKRKFLR
jgi:hypothetical protein